MNAHLCVSVSSFDAEDECNRFSATHLCDMSYPAQVRLTRSFNHKESKDVIWRAGGISPIIFGEKVAYFRDLNLGLARSLRGDLKWNDVHSNGRAW